MQDRGILLYRRFLEGDERALEELIALYQRGLLRFIFSYVHDEALAEDILQEVFIALYFKRNFKEQSDASFKTYLYKIARNKSLNEIKKRKRKREISLEFLHEKHGGLIRENAGENDAFSHDFINIPSEFLQSMQIEESLDRREILQMLSFALNEIKEEYREVLYLRYFEDLSPETIASITKKKSKQVYNLLSRGKIALKETLIKKGFDYENE